MTINTVLFDLDGTLADTAPDLAFALNRLLDEEGRAPLPFERIRPHVSHGGTALIRLGFAVGPEHADFPRLRLRFLDIYRDNIVYQTRLFPGVAELLEKIEDRGLRWGVVTNKPGWLTDPLMQALNLTTRAACIVSGDTTAKAKPHAEPMLYACAVAGCPATSCVYVGDAERDVEAGKKAGMRTLVALFGYIGADDPPEEWGADALIEGPLEVLEWVDRWNGGARRQAP